VPFPVFLLFLLVLVPVTSSGNFHEAASSRVFPRSFPTVGWGFTFLHIVTVPYVISTLPFLVPTKRFVETPRHVHHHLSCHSPAKQESSTAVSLLPVPIEEANHPTPRRSSLLFHSITLMKLSELHQYYRRPRYTTQSTVQYPQNPILHAATRPPSATACLRAWRLASPSATLELPGAQRSSRALPVASSAVNARAPQTTDHRPNGREILARYVAFGPSLSVCWSQISRFENAVDPCCLSTSSSAAKRSAEIWGDWDGAVLTKIPSAEVRMGNDGLTGRVVTAVVVVGSELCLSS
jgi:hypothetical protein